MGLSTIGSYTPPNRALRFGALGTFTPDTTLSKKAQTLFTEMLLAELKPEEQGPRRGTFEWNGKTYPARSILVQVKQPGQEKLTLNGRMLHLVLTYENEKPHALIVQDGLVGEQYLFPLTPEGKQLIHSSSESEQDQSVQMGDQGYSLVRVTANKVIKSLKLFGDVDFEQYSIQDLIKSG
jgi:hypothetical protein